MGIFSSKARNPIERLEAELAAQQNARMKLAGRLDAAQTALAERRAEAQRLAVEDASDHVLDKAEGASCTAEDRVTTLRATAAQLEQQIVETERELAAAQEQRRRDEVAVELEHMANGVREALPSFDTGTLALIEALTKSAASTEEITRFARSLDQTRHEVVATSNAVYAELRENAKRVREGTANVQYRVPAPPSPPPAAPLPPPIETTEVVYTLSALRWTEGGKVCTAPAYAKVRLPKRLIEPALAANHVDRLGSESAYSASDSRSSPLSHPPAAPVASGQACRRRKRWQRRPTRILLA